MDSFSNNTNASPEPLTVEETREILTPLAFKVDKSLFGLSLAVPWRRGAALTTDLFLVGILSEVPGELLALLVAITLFKAGSKKRPSKSGKPKGIRKTLLRIFAAGIVFVVLMEILPSLFTQLDTLNNNVERAGKNVTTLSNNTKISEDELSNNFAKTTLSVAANFAISHSDCKALTCWLQLSEALSSGYAEQSTSPIEQKKFNAKILATITEKSNFSTSELEQISSNLQKYQANKNTEKALSSVKMQAGSGLTDAEQLQENSDDLQNELAPLNSETKPEKIAEHNILSNNAPESPKVYKGLAWLKGLIEDLGLGFGWAAFYFTMFTALWYGQTPGKKLFNIRVIQLDGTPLSVWDSFGRYGGYGAGIATGLLGFAQIYWDPNRQAIHDKISSTVVINDDDFGRKKYQQNISK